MNKLHEVIKKNLRENSKSNGNVLRNPASTAYEIFEAAAKDYFLNELIPPDMARRHREGKVYINDLCHYSVTINCLHLPVADMFKKGFRNEKGFVRPPRHLNTAVALVAVLLQTTQNQCFGGQSIPAFDFLLSPFVKNETDDEIFQCMESLLFNLNTMHSRGGGQVVFSSLNFGLDTSINGRRITKQLLNAYSKGMGRGENFIFPNLLFLLKKGVNYYPNDPNYDLFQQAMSICAFRLNPTFVFCDSTALKDYSNEVALMGK